MVLLHKDFCRTYIFMKKNNLVEKILLWDAITQRSGNTEHCNKTHSIKKLQIAICINTVWKMLHSCATCFS